MLHASHITLREPRCEERVEVVALPGGRTMRARMWEGEGAPLVLLHGVLSSAATWRPLVRATARPCIALDLPGFGATSPATAPRLECFADDVVVALDALGVRRATLVGHSFGGAVAIAVAGCTDRVEELMLLAPGANGSCGLARLAIDPKLGPFATVLAPVLACSSALAARPTPHEVCSRRRRLRMLSHELRRALGVGRLNARTAMQASDREIANGHAAAACRAVFHGPVTILWGTRDRILDPAHGIAVQRALPGSSLKLLPGAGHAVHRERAAQIAGALSAVAR